MRRTDCNANANETITVLIPTFNRLLRLRRAIDSVLAQQGVPLRVHVFDNASTDGTDADMAALCQTDPRVRYTRHARNRGAIGNYQRALASVSTGYFVPLADDDQLLPGFLAAAHAVLAADATLGAAVFATQARRDDGTPVNTYPMAPEAVRYGRLAVREHLRDWLTHGHYAWSSILWRRAVLDAVGAPFLVAGLPSDVDFQLQAFCRFPVHVDRRIGAVYTLHEGQASGRYDQRQIPNWARVFARFDRSVARGRLFGPDEHRALRQCMYNAYRGTWTIAPATPLSSAEARRAALHAGLRLGDWETAFSLAAQAPGAADCLRRLQVRTLTAGAAQSQWSGFRAPAAPATA